MFYSSKISRAGRLAIYPALGALSIPAGDMRIFNQEILNTKLYVDVDG